MDSREPPVLPNRTVPRRHLIGPAIINAILRGILTLETRPVRTNHRPRHRAATVEIHSEPETGFPHNAGHA